MDRWNKPRTERTLPAIRLHSTRDEDNKAGKVLVFRPQTVGSPGSEGRSARLLEAGVHEKLSGSMIKMISRHRIDDAEIVSHTVQVRNRVRHPKAVLAILFKRTGQSLGRLVYTLRERAQRVITAL